MRWKPVSAMSELTHCQLYGHSKLFRSNKQTAFGKNVCLSVPGDQIHALPLATPSTGEAKGWPKGKHKALEAYV